jgi:acyl-ACP dehydrogenase
VAQRSAPRLPKLVALAFALGRLDSAGIGVGVSLHDSAIAILRRFGRSDYLKDICEQAIRGEAVLCIGASQESGGSDLQIVRTEVRSVREGFEVRGIRSLCRCPRWPTTSWWSPVAWTMTRTAATATCW